MAKLKFKTGGRPLTLDTEKVEAEIFQRLPKVKKTLYEFRQTTSGVRQEELVGSHTTLPEWLDASIMALQDEKNITLDIARDIKQSLNLVRLLSSQKKASRETALEPIFTKQYQESLQKAIKSSTPKAARTYQKIQKYIQKATKQERMNFYKSRKYQDPGTFRNRRYKKIRNWAQHSKGEQMTYNESYAYLIERRAEDGLGIGDLDQLLNEDELFGE